MPAGIHNSSSCQPKWQVQSQGVLFGGCDIWGLRREGDGWVFPRRLMCIASPSKPGAVLLASSSKPSRACSCEQHTYSRKRGRLTASKT